MLVCGYFAFFIYLFFAVIGVLLKVYYQEVEFSNANEVILDFVFNHTNPIVIGLIMSRSLLLPCPHWIPLITLWPRLLPSIFTSDSLKKTKANSTMKKLQER
ncbi:sodium-solute symporter [Vibrio ishigakensis]|uniref:Sodium-solute symporter n=1 Tax=Vibrio ishigakensis TaxID=1481914 RepID=A0A0B8Q9Z1_9VIBR|nr:sodium-solute symporter [Vibrio ishigakensis]